MEDIRRDFASAKSVGEDSANGMATWGHGGSEASTVSMEGWTLETAYQDDIFSIMPVEIVPLYLASLREHGKSRGLSFDNVAKNLVYVPQQFLPENDPKTHLEQLWNREGSSQEHRVHIITDESVGGVSRHAKLLQRSNELGVGSIVVSTVGFERIMGAPFRLVEPDSMPDEQEASVEWLQGHVRAAAQETFRSFAHIGSEHVDQVARSVLTDPASYESSSDGVPCVKSHAQLASLMVKYSFSNRLRHLSRALPKEIVGDVLKDVEKLTVATYEGLLGDDLQFDEILARRVILPNRLGGIAMGSSPCADAAYVAASAKMEGFVVTSDFFSAARALLSEHTRDARIRGRIVRLGFMKTRCVRRATWLTRPLPRTLLSSTRTRRGRRMMMEILWLLHRPSITAAPSGPLLPPLPPLLTFTKPPCLKRNCRSHCGTASTIRRFSWRGASLIRRRAICTSRC